MFLPWLHSQIVIVSLVAEVDNEKGVRVVCFVEREVKVRVVHALIPTCRSLTLASFEYKKDSWPGSWRVLLAKTPQTPEPEFSACPDSINMSSTSVPAFLTIFEVASGLVVLEVV